MKRIVVAGCRDYCDYEYFSKVIDKYMETHNIENAVFITGGCRGVDMLGERYANEHGFPVERYEADWKQYGRAAGPVRNQKMAVSSDIVICFWDQKSRGTRSMIEYAKKYEKILHIESI